MAILMKKAKCLLLLISPCLLLSTGVYHVNSLSFDYNFSAPGVLAASDLKYLGDSAAARDRIDLTLDSNWSTGRVAHGQPLLLWDSNTGKVASFTTNFTVVIRPINRTNQAQGDGMAFFVGPYPASMPVDARGGYLGLFNNPHNLANDFPPTVAVELDACKNEWDPNGIVNHVGVDVNSITSKEYTALPDVSFNGRTISAWVRYDANATTLSATLRFHDMPEPNVYNVSASVDLRAAKLSQDAAVGFSAATGELVEKHQIIAWSFESTLTSVAVIPKIGSTSKASNGKRIGLRAGLIAGGTFIFLIIGAWIGYLKYNAKSKHPKHQLAPGVIETPLDKDMDNEFEKGTGPRRFSYSALLQATRGFSDEEKIGEGGFGAVYRGFLQDPELHVAIKRVSKTSRQGRREYISEVTIISRLRHRNLVQLLGWCHETDELLLVYELMMNGSLDTHLYNPTNILTWPTRYKIILGMGSALLYLHQEWEQCVVHRDIKPSNVMLDESFNAKLGDFGLARLVDHSRGAHTTMLAGTRGYMDPRCVLTGRASTVSDVYSFGIVLLEITCGRKPVVPEEEESCVLIVDWVWQLYGRGALVDAADGRLAGEFDDQELRRALVVGLWCVHPDFGYRPSIRQAMNALQLEAPLPDLPPEMPVARYDEPRRYTSSYTGSDLTACSIDWRSATRRSTSPNQTETSPVLLGRSARTESY